MSIMNFYDTHILPKILDFTMRRKYFEDQRKDVIGGVSGTVLEIGFGSGLNLPYYTDVTKLYALEPSKELWELAQLRIGGLDFDVEYLQESAEAIPLEDGSVDHVVSTWTLCSIPDIEIALREVHRVLKPGGTFSFVDHGKSPRSFVYTLQKFFTPCSKCLAGGCHLDRDIETLIQEAGFTIEKLETYQMNTTPLAFMYKGVTVKK
jgi:ubiquinone/menaquinone biosynthesis C-methylase UbiE